MIEPMAERVGAYPRPDFDRSDAWQSMDGKWDFFPDVDQSLTVNDVSRRPAVISIVVPGPWEEGSSEGRHDWLECGWYRAVARRPKTWDPQLVGEHTILHFGAVFESCQVWVNEILVATHAGGYLPFDADVSEALDSSGEGVVVVRATSPKDKRSVPHGKQRSLPYDDYNGCSFTPASGIWQTVWLEPRSAAWLGQIHLLPLPGLDGFAITATCCGESPEAATVTARCGSLDIELAWDEDSGEHRGRLAIPEPMLWEPDNPHLYHVDVTLRSTSGSDAVRTYSGLRSVETSDGRILLNGAPMYLRGVLDQGYWPGRGMTAPSEDALVRDLELAAEAGFNLVRKHLKLEDPRWLYHADRLGMLVWAEPASTGQYSPKSAAAVEREIAGMIARDLNHPCIVIWCAYNEEWGLDWDLNATPEHRHALVAAFRLIKRLDPSRLAVDNSGWTHVETDLIDWHYYNEDPWAFYVGMKALLSDVHADFDVWHSAKYPIRKSLGAADFERAGEPIINSEYGGGWNSLERAWHSRWQTQFMRAQSDNQGYVYTELYDIEHETVGVYAFDRSSKDQGGFDHRTVHAETVICPMVEPIQVGFDVVAPGSQPLPFTVVVSHHGREPLTGTLGWKLDGATQWSDVVVRIEPFVPSAPVTLQVDLPARYERTTLQLRVVSDAGGIVARTHIDLSETSPSSNLPSDGGWRPLCQIPETDRKP